MNLGDWASSCAGVALGVVLFESTARHIVLTASRNLPRPICPTLTKIHLMKMKTKQTREEIFAEFCCQDPVMLFSMGKTATTALYDALEQHLDRYTIRLEELPISFGNLKLHHLGGYRKSELCDYLLDRYVHPNADCDVLSLAGEHESRLKIICPIREPIGRDVSSFYEAALQNYLAVTHVNDSNYFVLTRRMAGLLPPSWKSVIRQGLGKLPGGLVASKQSHGWIYDDKKLQQIIDLDPKQLRDIYLEVHSERSACSNNHVSAIDWFDTYVRTPLSLDVFAKKFPAERAACYSMNRTDMMILEYSLDNRRKAQLVKDFLGIDQLKISHSNVTDRKLKVLADSYALFKREVKFPRWYLDKMLHSQYFQHFYTGEDEERLRQHWAE